MVRAIHLAAFGGILTMCAVSVNAQPKAPQVVWEPPNFALPSQFPKPMKQKPIITSLTVAGIPIQLEHTRLDLVSRSLHAPEGSRGDAGEALGWICLYGRDEEGFWGLWLMSGEIDGPMIGSFQWQRLPSDAQFDHRCRVLGHSIHPIQLPVDIRLGMTESQLEATLGKPTSKFHNTWLYSRERDLTLHGEPYSADNDVFIFYDNDVASALVVHYTISS
ncbi:MAG: hypothetical protein JST61_05860 [Acidobacteria bacterium]|nr:hypothetical protein [Acidobacteriota bacterium]